MRWSVVPTVGVEEEFLLVEPRTGAVLPAAPSVIRDCDAPDIVVAESMRFLVETRTPVCRTLREVDESIRATRDVVAAAARRNGAVLVASGVPPYGLPERPLLTDDTRYRELARRFPAAMAVAGVCGCHVHIGIPSRAAGVDALRRLRPWLPALIALTVNSPVWRGTDSGWSSRRHLLTARWPTAVPPPAVATPAAYDARVEQAIARGDALDPRSVYYLARLSPRHPTLEVRVADVALSAADAVGYAGLVRALVATALREGVRGDLLVDVSDAVLRSSCRLAARLGPDARALGDVDDLLAHVDERLDAFGDTQAVLALADRVRRGLGGARRQVRYWSSAATPQGFVASLARATAGELPS